MLWRPFGSMLVKCKEGGFQTAILMFLVEGQFIYPIRTSLDHRDIMDKR